jgi:hypothetical protein
MRRKFIRHSVLTLAMCLGGLTNAIAAGGVFTRGCAARDMQVMMLIEASAISPQKRNDAVRTMMHARIVCFDGQVADALALYDNIAHGITPDWLLSGE